MATLADVAQRAGVSTTTVSRVLNNKMVMPISQTTIERIQDAARALNYRPNTMARALATGRNQAIGLYSVAMTHPLFMQMLEAVERRARELGYFVVVSSMLDGLSDRGRIDGLLAFGLPTDLDFMPIADQMGRDGLSIVYVNRSTKILPRTISWDDAAGVGQAVRHLIELGHRRIAMLCGYSRALAVNDPKVEGFREALRRETPEGAALGRVFWSEQRPNWRDMNAQFDNGYDTAGEMLDDWPEVTALIADNDHMAAGAVRALRERGLSVPEHISIIGYTDSSLAHCTLPALTSVRTPIAESGVRGVERLLREIETREIEIREGEEGEIMPTRLVLRESCAPPRR